MRLGNLKIHFIQFFKHFFLSLFFQKYAIRTTGKIRPSNFLFHGPRSRLDSLDAGLVDDSHVQIVDDANLAGKPRVIAQIGFCRQDGPFGLAYLARIARHNFHPAGRAARVPAAAMKDVDTVILKA
jgi:hypothetical protein